MSLLRGEPDSDRNLAHAADRMAAAAREAARPSSAWLTGLVYQNLNLGWAFSVVVGWPVLTAALPEVNRIFGGLLRTDDSSIIQVLFSDWSAATFGVLLALPLLFRLVAGFASLFANRGTRPTVGGAWGAGHGLGIPAAGLWLQVVLMMLGAALVFVGPIALVLQLLDIDTDQLVGVLLTGLCIALILFYGFVMTILYQIGLHSLVRNRRGVGSALLHSWRIAKNDPSATARMAVIDFLLLVGLFVVWLIYKIAAGVAGVMLPDVMDLLLILPELALVGIGGYARCSYWARTYELLGGLSTSTEVEGLAPGA